MDRNTTLSALLEKVSDDPWSLTTHERVRLLQALQGAQQRWLPRLAALVEPPAPEPAFPAFLLEVGPYARLNATIGLAQSQLELDPLTRDELQHFVDHFRGWLDAAGNDLPALLPEKVALVE